MAVPRTAARAGRGRRTLQASDEARRHASDLVHLGSECLRGGGCARVADVSRLVQRTGRLLCAEEEAQRGAGDLEAARRGKSAGGRRGRSESHLQVPAKPNRAGHAGADPGVHSVGDGQEPRRGLQGVHLRRGLNGPDLQVRAARDRPDRVDELSLLLHPISCSHESRGRLGSDDGVHCGKTSSAAAAGEGAGSGCERANAE